MRWILTALLIGFLLPAYSQIENVMGKVNSGSFLGPLGKVYVRMGKYSTKTDYDGKFSVHFSENEPLILSHSNYHTQKISSEDVHAGSDVTYYLTPTSGMANMILESEETEAIYDPEFEHVFDYTFLNDTLIILSYMNLHKAQQSKTKPYVNCTLTAMRYGEMIDRKVMPNYIERLFKHPGGDLYFECPDTSYVLKRDHSNISFLGVDYKLYQSFISLAYAENSQGIFFESQYPYIPQVAHRMYSLSNNEVYLLRLIQNKAYFNKVEDDYAMLNPLEIEEAKNLEKETGINSRMFSTLLRSYYKLRDLTVPYAPGFMVNDTVIVFDHINNRADYYNGSGKLLNTLGMYHNNLQREELIKLVQDPFTQKVYTLHDKGGVHFIREINTRTASTGRPFKLKYPFPENVKVFENHVYYLHKSARDSKLNHLVREKLPFSIKENTSKSDPNDYYSE